MKVYQKLNEIEIGEIDNYLYEYARATTKLRKGFVWKDFIEYIRDLVNREVEL
jgi:hypothetical protein